MAEQSQQTPYKVPITNLGKTGLRVSRICFGCMSFGSGDQGFFAWSQPKEVVLPFVKRCIEAGINFFDTANIYSSGLSEQILGQCLKELNVYREDVVIATKFGGGFGTGAPNRGGRGRKHIFAAVEESLKNLGTDYIDLYIVHSWHADSTTPLEETMEALNDLVRSGKVRYIGTSNMKAWQLVKANNLAEKKGWAKFISVQNLYNPIYREDEREIFPACADLGVGLTPWSPLHTGFLAGTRKKGEKTETSRASITEVMMTFFNPKDADWPVIDRVIELAAKKGIPPAQVAIAWNLSRPNVSSPIIGATKLNHLEDAIAATKITLTEEDIKFIDELYVGKLRHPFEER